MLPSYKENDTAPNATVRTLGKYVLTALPGGPLRHSWESQKQPVRECKRRQKKASCEGAAYERCDGHGLQLVAGARSQCPERRDSC